MERYETSFYDLYRCFYYACNISGKMLKASKMPHLLPQAILDIPAIEETSKSRDVYKFHTYRDNNTKKCKRDL